jgi:hypothetical protein
MGIGVIGRNHLGQVLAAYCDTKPFVTAEAWGAWRAVELSRTMGWRKVKLEGDALEIIQAFERNDTWRGSYGVLVQDARQQLDRLLEWKMQHVSRQANVEAHSLAKYALSLETEHLWTTDFPVCISPRVCFAS